MKKYKVGDKVRVKTHDANIGVGGYVGGRMRELCGKVCTISYVFDNAYKLKEDTNGFYWMADNFESYVVTETKYKPGDVVTVRYDLKHGSYEMANGDNPMWTTDQMLTKRGQKVKIKSVTKTGKYMIEGSIFPWVDEMFVDESKVEPKKTTEPRFKVGDKVRVRTDLKVGNIYSMADGKTRDSFVDSMTSLKGKVVTIKSVGDKYHIKESGYNWTDEMFEPDVVKEEPKKTEPDCKFKVGDRVKIVEAYCNAEVGMVGTLKHHAGYWAVEFPEGFRGHDCGGCVRGKRGHWVPERCMVQYPEFDWEAFKKGKVIVHLDTVEKEKAFLKECGEHGLRWTTDDKADKNSYWERYKSNYSIMHGTKSCSGLSYSYLDYHKEYKKDAVVYEYELPATKEPVKKWELVIRGEGDNTTAEYIVNDVKTTAEVHRFHEDQYSVHKAIEAVTQKILPEEKWVVDVKFDKGGKVYNYYTTDNTIKAGDKVVVPTGKDNHHVAVTVVNIQPASEVLATVLPDNMKYVDCKCTEEDIPKYYNGKVVCVKTDYPWFTVGKIYEVKDGILTPDYGGTYPDHGQTPYRDADDVRHAGNGGTEKNRDYRHNVKNEFIPIVE